jgi:uncharacterized MAPEG superfamily protein
MARPDDDREARLLASRQLGRAKRTIHAIRNFYIANAMLAGLVLGVVLLAGAPPLFIAIAAAVFLLTLAGIRGVRSEPFLWTLGAAAVWTLLVVAEIVAGAAARPNIWFFLHCTWALGCWLMLPTTRRVRELLRAHPDLWVSRQMRGSRKRR